MPASRRDDLINAAMRVFYRHGFHSSCLDKVLQEGGISRMTLYNHFKSKDELILAALRRRDETFRHQMMKFVDGRAKDPIGRILAVFDFYGDWFSSDDFCGCMFINVSAEFEDPDGPVRRFAAETKLTVMRYVRDQCELAKLADPDTIAFEIHLLLEGAIVTAHIIGQVPNNDIAPGDAALRAKHVVKRLLKQQATNTSPSELA